MKWLKLETILPEILTRMQDPEFTPFEVSFDGDTLFTNKDVFDVFAYNYSSYSCIVSSVYQPTTAYFINLWTAYVNETVYMLKRQIDAITAEYNPIDNYNMTEKAADGRKLGKMTDTTTPTGGTHTESTTKQNGLGSAATGEPYAHVETDVTPLTGTKTEVEHTATNDQTGAVGSDTVSGHEVTEHVMTRSGNIGVTTNATMVTQEYELRKINVLKDYVKQFAAQHLYSIGGDCP